MRIGVVGTFLAGSLSVAGGAPIAVSAANTVVGTSTHALAYQHSSEDKVAYLHDGSLLVGYFDGSQAVIKRVTNPATSPAVSLVENIAQGSQVTLYTLPGVNTTEIWIVVGNELYGGTKREQIQYSTFNGSTFTLGTVYTIPGAFTNGRQDPTVTWTGKWLIVSWWDDTMGGNSDSIFMNWTTVKSGASGWLSKSGTTLNLGNGKNGTTAAALTLKSGTTAAATLAGASTISYTLGSGPAPVAGDLFEFGNGAVSSEARTVTGVIGAAPYVLTVSPSLTNAHAMGETDTTATRITYTAVSGSPPVATDVFVLGSGTVNQEVATVTAVTGSAPYVFTVAPLTHNHALGEIDTIQTWTINYTQVTGGAPLAGDLYQLGDGTNAEYRVLTSATASTMTFAGLVNAHVSGETDTQAAAIQLTTVGSAIAQVSIRHSAKLGATIAVYGARSRVLTRTLLDTKATPALVNWSAERQVDPALDDSEWGFGGPQIAIDETTGLIHVFRAVTTNGGPGWTGVTYWLGTPDATFATSGNVNWNSRLVIDSTAGPNDPPDIAGAVDSAGRVFVFWTTTAIGGAIKYVTIESPYTAFSGAVTVVTNGTQPRFPHVPAQAPLTRGIVPLVYQSGTGSPFSINVTAIPDFAGYSSLGGGLIGGPDASASSANKEDVFVHGTDNQLWHKSWNGSTWGQWEPLGGVLTSDPGAVAVAPNNINVFVRGSDQQLWENVWTGSVWSGWQPLAGILTSGPDADSWVGISTHVDVFVRGTDNGLWHKWSDDGSFAGWEPLGGGLTSDPGTVSWGPNRADVFVRGTDNQLWHKWWDGIAWRPWEPLGGVLTSGPDPASCASGHLDVFAIGTDSQLWRKGYNGTSWGQWEPLGGMWTGGIGAVCNPGSGAIDVFTHGSDNALWTVSVPAS